MAIYKDKKTGAIIVLRFCPFWRLGTCKRKKKKAEAK